jgi:hypothetical protein
MFDPRRGEGLEGVGLEVGQGVGRGAGDRGEGAFIEASAHPLGQVRGEEALVVWDFLKMLPLPEFAYGVQSSLPVELMVEGFVEGCSNARGNVCFHVGQESPPTVGSFHSEWIVVQTGAGCPHCGEHSVGHRHEGVVGVVDWNLGGITVVVFAEGHLEAGAAEFHVGVPHPPGETAASQGSQGVSRCGTALGIRSERRFAR